MAHAASRPVPPRPAPSRPGASAPGKAPFPERTALFSLSLNEVMNSGLLPILVLLAAYLNSDHFTGFFVDVVGTDLRTAWLFAVFFTGCGMVGVWELGRMKKRSPWAYMMVIAFMVVSVAASMVAFEDGFSKVDEKRAVESASFRLAEGAVISADANLATARGALDRATRAKNTFESSIANDSASDRGQQRRDRGASYQADIDAARATFNAAAAAHASAIGAAQGRLSGAGEGGEATGSIATIGGAIGLSPEASRWTLAFLLAVFLSCGILSIMYYATVIFMQHDDDDGGDGARADGGTGNVSPLVQPRKSGPDARTAPPAATAEKTGSAYARRTGRRASTAMPDSEIEAHARTTAEAAWKGSAIFADGVERDVALRDGTLSIGIISALCGIGKDNAARVQQALPRELDRIDERNAAAA